MPCYIHPPFNRKQNAHAPLNVGDGNFYMSEGLTRIKQWDYYSRMVALRSDAAQNGQILTTSDRLVDHTEISIGGI